MSIRAAILLATLPLAWACSSSGTQQAGRPAPRYDQYLISAEELATVNASNLYEAIRLLRPQWLQTSGVTSLISQGNPPILVYMDRIRFGEPDQLRSVPISLPREVRWLSASQAQGEFGVGNLVGAIQIVTRRVQ